MTSSPRSSPQDSVRGYIQRLAGLDLIGKVIEHVFPIAIGTGRNGTLY